MNSEKLKNCPEVPCLKRLIISMMELWLLQGYFISNYKQIVANICKNLCM